MGWTSVWTIGQIGVFIRWGPDLLRKDAGAILQKGFGCVWVDVLRGLGGLILVHVAALADIVSTLSCDIRTARACFFA